MAELEAKRARNDKGKVTIIGRYALGIGVCWEGVDMHMWTYTCMYVYVR